jgi:signal transduction histidine kinase
MSSAVSIRSKLKRFIFGAHEFTGSHADFKSIMLCGQLALVAFVVGVTYILIDVVNQIFAFLIFYGVILAMAIAVLILLRNTFYFQAKVVLLTIANLLIFIFASNDTFEAGIYIYFIVSSVMGLSLFGFNRLNIAIGFCGLSLLLFFLAYWGLFKIITFTPAEIDILHDEHYVRISFLSNFIIVFFLCAILFYFLLDVNQHSEKQIMAKNDELAKTNQELDRFVYSASHDLRAPLSSLLGLIAVSQHTKSKEDLDRCFSMMKDRVHDLEKFIAEIIDFSRNARLAVQQVPVNLLSLSKKVVEGLRFAHGNDDTLIRYHIPADLEFIGDPTRLKVILNNLIDNAIKYQDSTKPFHQIDLTAERQGTTVQLEIKDNGIGIPPEYHQRIFEMFYRASEQSHGSGLGLYIVKETIEKLNGDIRFTSAPGNGTSFFITLPV